MAVTKKKVILAILSTIANSSYAEKLLPGKWKSKFIFNFYDQDSNNGDQVYDGTKDEGLTVIEPMLFISHQIDSTTNVSGHVVLDAWSAESDTKLDGNTGESGKGIGNQSRVSGNFSYAKEINKVKLTPHLGFSSEYDYKSFNGGLAYEQSFAKDNFVLGLGVDYFHDSTKLFDYANEKTTDFKDKRVYSYNISASQILTYTDIINFNINYIRQTGALESIRNSTPLNGSRYPENLPALRDRFAASTQFIHGFNDENSISLKYRYYKDSWEMKASTIETSYRKMIQDDDGFLEFNYRYHTQDEVEYFKKSLITAQTYVTSDSDQASFDANRFGMLYSFNRGEVDLSLFKTDKFEYTIAAYHYFRSNKLKYNVLQASLGIEF
ncbi:DUF3570 domain-containing protein [Bacteriovorax sp. Seq25_V]|uniref:DUF3570 domain-containing protein n=1 Tax=Bacteriovorax sp. Seq25_V TaxID=1201288 RepID=UPI000389DE43|nr:DUF3570 domain-containing protein [Bacteriovorax sp. Seq25_V]EQC47252.1 PF12094 family protein [Bacteriovorax sp. Seq25_V]